MPVLKLPLKQIEASTQPYANLGEQLSGMSHAHQEEYIAAEGQQTFTLTRPYTTGAKQLKVFVNGALQQEGPDGGYIELNSTTVMFTEPLEAGDVVIFRIEGAGAGFVAINTKGEKLTPAEVKALYEANANTNAFTDADKAKLATIELYANRYIHPDTHPASMIVEDSMHRFVTDEEKERWNRGADLDYTPLNKAGDIVEGDLAVNGMLTVHQDILPAENGTINIGSPSLRFKGIYVDEAHLSVSTLYIGSTPVLGTEESDINLKAEPNQSIDIKTTGIGEVRVSSEKLIDISTPEGVQGDINIHADNENSAVNIAAGGGVSINSPEVNVSGDITANGTVTANGLVVNGDAVFNGNVFQVTSENVTTSDTMITLNSGEPGAGVSAGTAGIKIDRGTLADYNILFDENDDQLKIGFDGELKPVADKDWVSNSFTPVSHHGANGNVHAVATQSMAGFMSPEDKAKLDGIEPGANRYVHPLTKQCNYQYVHPTGDGNLHVPATGTENNGKVLKAGNTPGSIGWGYVDWNEVANKPGPATDKQTGFMSAADKIKLDSIAYGAEVNQNAFSAVKIGTKFIQASTKTDYFELVAGEGVSISIDEQNKKIIVSTDVNATARSLRKYRQPVIGVIDGQNTVFQIAEDIVPDSEEIFVNGLLMDKGIDNDYTINGRVITFNEPIPVGAKILVSYDVAQ